VSGPAPCDVRRLWSVSSRWSRDRSRLGA
jgi:hypothetical protein